MEGKKFDFSFCRFLFEQINTKNEKTLSWRNKEGESFKVEDCLTELEFILTKMKSFKSKDSEEKFLKILKQLENFFRKKLEKSEHLTAKIYFENEPV